MDLSRAAAAELGFTTVAGTAHVRGVRYVGPAPAWPGPPPACGGPVIIRGFAMGDIRSRGQLRRSFRPRAAPGRSRATRPWPRDRDRDDLRPPRPFMSPGGGRVRDGAADPGAARATPAPIVEPSVTFDPPSAVVAQIRSYPVRGLSATRTRAPRPSQLSTAGAATIEPIELTGVNPLRGCCPGPPTGRCLRLPSASRSPRSASTRARCCGPGVLPLIKAVSSAQRRRARPGSSGGSARRVRRASRPESSDPFRAARGRPFG